MLGKRLLTALWGIPLVIAAVWFDKPVPWFTVLAVIAGAIGAIEFFRLTGVLKTIPLAVCGIVFSLLFIIYPHLDALMVERVLLILITGSLIIPLVIMLVLSKPEGFIKNWAWTVAGIFYIGWLISFLVLVRLDAGRNWLFFTLFVIFASDTAAYFIGKAVGRHKLAPSISPGKTWEGAVAGVLGAALVGYLFTLKTPLQVEISWLQAVILGIIVSILGQFGDLVESMFKRGVGVKDSGTIMPGHGGILDRLDSILFAGVGVYLYYIFVIL